ncbi:MAG: hypothetical protein IJ780_04715 [Neisseriaceae bacterium]|nr:hypothetical protein [Neisseriaceae bacterium]MBR1819411.1 hypothetical protein [Neisseriaceae bacterium]
MIKKTSFIIIITLFFNNIFADDFVPLQYYDEEISLAPIPVSTFSYSTNPISGYAPDLIPTKMSEQYAVDCKMRQGIVENELPTVEMYSRESSLKPETIDEIFAVMNKGDNQTALELFDSELFINCDIFAEPNDWEDEYAIRLRFKPKTNKYGGGKNDKHANIDKRNVAGEKLEQAKQDLENAKRNGASKRELEEYKRNVRHWQNKVNETGENHSMKPKGNR